MHIYLVVSGHVVGLVLVKLVEGTQKLVYYASKALEDVETRHSYIKKLALALFILSKKLCPSSKVIPS